jgi:hypothetical protein
VFLTLVTDGTQKRKKYLCYGMLKHMLQNNNLNLFLLFFVSNTSVTIQLSVLALKCHIQINLNFSTVFLLSIVVNNIIQQLN